VAGFAPRPVSIPSRLLSDWDGLQAVNAVKPPENGIDIIRIKFNAKAFSPCPLRGEERGPAARENIEHNGAALGASMMH
jgi:hypothetical protein